MLDAREKMIHIEETREKVHSTSNPRDTNAYAHTKLLSWATHIKFDCKLYPFHVTMNVWVDLFPFLMQNKLCNMCVYRE